MQLSGDLDGAGREKGRIESMDVTGHICQGRGGLGFMQIARVSPNCRFRSISKTECLRASIQPRLVLRKVAPLPPLQGSKAMICP